MNFRKIYLPDISVTRRLRIFKTLLALATLASLLVSWKLWAGERLMPHVPAFEGLPKLPLLAEQILFGTMIVSCILIALARKPGIFILLLLSALLFLCLCDINRIQPWLFQYFLFFFLLVFYNWRVDEPREYTPVFSSVRICVAAFYTWDAIHKMNPTFANETWPWMLSTFEPVFSHKAISFLGKAAFVIPGAELLAALSLFLPTMKRIGIPVLVLIHLVNLICIGPAGQNFNPVLWPWHISMMFMVYSLFAGRAESKFHSIAYTINYKPMLLAAIAIAVLPLLPLSKVANPGKLTDFNPHPETTVLVELSNEAAGQLPLYLACFLKESESRKALDIEKWSLHELNSPLNGSRLVYAAVAAELKKITCCPQHVNLRFKEKSGTVASL